MGYPYIVVGLGNPGDAYANNRHNVGFMTVDALHEFNVALPWLRDKDFNGQLAISKFPPTYYVKPETMMNSSGECVGPAMRYFKSHSDRVIVIHDDLDLPLGKVKAKLGGGHGGHNGLKSIDKNIGPDYWRVRIGIGRPEHKGQVLSYVLGDFNEVEMAIQKITIRAIVEAFPLLLDGDDNGFMNKVALLTQPKEEKVAED